MCLLFFKTASDVDDDEFRLVLVNVRDEYYARPTKLAGFWDNYTSPQIIGPRDLQPKREGGTWIAMSSSGKIASLLNVLQPDHMLEYDKRGRGFIVVDYLVSDLSPYDYCQQLSKEGDEYNGFLCVALELMKGNQVQASCYSNHYHREPQLLQEGVHGFGNNLKPDLPWPKVRQGKKRFEEICSKYSKVNQKEALIEEIFQMLSDSTPHLVDDQMKAQGEGKSMEFLQKLSALWVEIPKTLYGSRTWTVILVDGKSRVTYVEKTLKEPIACDPLKGVKTEWVVNHHNFNLECDDADE